MLMDDLTPIPPTDASAANLPATAPQSVDTSPPRKDNRHAVSDTRESLCNERATGPASRIALPVNQVASIHGFMIDIDLSHLAHDTLGGESLASVDAFYASHLGLWLDRDPVLAKAEVRDTGHGVHVLLWLDKPVVCSDGDQQTWNGIVGGLRTVLPGDPKVNGINAMTRPVGAENTKSDPVMVVRQLRAGQPVTRAEILDLVTRATRSPAELWMRVFHGGDSVSPCPLCLDANSTLRIAGNWQCQCYECGRKDAASLLYRLYNPKFLELMKGATNG